MRPASHRLWSSFLFLGPVGFFGFGFERLVGCWGWERRQAVRSGFFQWHTGRSVWVG